MEIIPPLYMSPQLSGSQQKFHEEPMSLPMIAMPDVSHQTCYIVQEDINEGGFKGEDDDIRGWDQP